MPEPTKKNTPKQNFAFEKTDTVYTEKISQISLGPHVVKLLLTQDQGREAKDIPTHNLIMPTLTFLQFILHTLRILNQNEELRENFKDYADEITGLLDQINPNPPL